MKVIFSFFFSIWLIIGGFEQLAGQIITTIAGNCTSGYCCDGGAATSAYLTGPSGVAVDNSGNIYIADYQNLRVRKVDTAGIITTFAGNGTYGSSGDGGPASASQLGSPMYVAVDGAGNVYISDNGVGRIRKVNAAGIITTYAGAGSSGAIGDGGQATATQLGFPYGIAVDNSGNLFIAEYFGHRIRKVNPAGIITTVAGNGTAGTSGDGGPATAAEIYFPCNVCVDGTGNLFIVDYYNGKIRKVNSSGIITNVAGTGTSGYSGDGGPATAAMLYFPQGVITDNGGNLYIGDEGNYMIRKVSPSGIITVYAGGGSLGCFCSGVPATTVDLRPWTLAIDGSGNIYQADYSAAAVNKITPPPCTSRPAAGIVTASATTGCGVYSSKLILTSSTIGAGLTYQWQYSNDSATWVSISGATNNSYSAMVTAQGFYRCIVTCAATGNTDTTTGGAKLSSPTAVAGTITGPASVCVGGNDTLTASPAGGIWHHVNYNAFLDGGIVTGLVPGADTISYMAGSVCGTFPIHIINCATSLPLFSAQTTEHLTIAPNPLIDGRFTINLQSSTDESAEVTISSVTGEQVLHFSMLANSNKVITLEQAPGIYFVRMVTSHAIYCDRIVLPGRD